MRAARHLVWASALVVIGCGGGGDGTSMPVPDDAIRKELPSIPLAAGEEQNDTCFAWTLDNDEPIYVNAVRMQANSAGIHHSNWFHVTESVYGGPDGIFSCDSRGFDTSGAAISGGVLFAQSTQNTDETMQFAEGVALRIPPASRIIGDLHLLNVSAEDTDVQIDLTMHTATEAETETILQGFSINYLPLEIQPRMRSEFSVECDFDAAHRRVLDRPLDFSIHYLLPHYHELGDMLSVEVVGGPNDGETVWETRAALGEPFGSTLDPPVDLAGATGLRLTCGFDNPRDEVVGWGVGDQEMCMAFGFTDSDRLWSGTTSGAENQVLGMEGDTMVNTTDGCRVLTAVPRGARR